MTVLLAAAVLVVWTVVAVGVGILLGGVLARRERQRPRSWDVVALSNGLLTPNDLRRPRLDDGGPAS